MNDAVLEPRTDFSRFREVTRQDFIEFRRHHARVKIEDVEIELHDKWQLKDMAPADTFRPESTTVWSFPDRGSWATHNGSYRGNWSPYIPRNLILRYTNPGDLVLDQMVGSGTTLVECKLLLRNAIGIDINLDALMVTQDRINFSYQPLDTNSPLCRIQTFLGDARELSGIPDSSVDLIATHPPYANIISYSGTGVEGDLSSIKSVEEFVNEIRKVASESYRVLKPGKHCAILIGETRRKKHLVPIAARVMEAFLSAGFVLREDIIKLQHNMKSTRENWRGKRYDFLLIAHERLFVFRKLVPNERVSDYQGSSEWHFRE